MERLGSGTDEGCGGQEVSGEFIVARCDAPPVFDTADVVFDSVASSVKALGTIGFLGCIAAAGDDRQSPLILYLLAHFLAVAGLVGGGSQWWSLECRARRQRPDCRGPGRPLP
jgi:hypothetical protein